MSADDKVRVVAKVLGVAAAITAAAYAASVGMAWRRYGHTNREDKGRDLELDRFMPEYDAVERHNVRVAAPAKVAFSAACNVNVERSVIVRALFKSRELALRGNPEAAQSKATPFGQGLVAQAKTWGWGVLAEKPGAWIIFGGVTQPWDANPVFRALPPGEFAAFCEPGYVKIAWTLRVDSINAMKSIARTETRVTTTDAAARAKFRRYWAFTLPGIKWIRRIALGLVKTEAERLTRQKGAQ